MKRRISRTPETSRAINGSVSLSCFKTVEKMSKEKYVVLRGIELGNVFWTTNSDNNTHSQNGELWYEELLFTNSEEEAIKECDKQRILNQ